MTPSLLGGITPAAFLRDYWQKKPLLIRGAFPGFKDPLSPDELAGLAMEEGVRARLVLEKGGAYPWQLQSGPFAESALRQLPTSHWTLLVQDVNAYVEDAAAILDNFDFIPSWRVEDLMVSFAPIAGTVGAHVDSYDVFLIQGMGRRRWQIQSKPELKLKTGLDLRILKSFKPEDEWVLEPGDMLYVPPGVAHYGVALENCMTYSVGYRAPKKADLALALLDLPEALAARVKESFKDELYSDPNLRPAVEPGRIGADVLQRLRDIFAAALHDDEVLGRWFAGFSTRAADGSLVVRSLPKPMPAAKVAAKLEAMPVVRRNEWERLAYFVSGEGSRNAKIFVAVGSEEVELSASCLPLVQLICGQRCLATAAIRNILPRGKARAEAQTFLGILLAAKILYFSKR